MTKSDSNFTQTFVHPRLLPGISFNGYYFTISVNNIHIPPPKKYIYMCAYMYIYINIHIIYIYIYIYFLHTKSIVKKFKQILFIQ